MAPGQEEEREIKLNNFWQLIWNRDYWMPFALISYKH